MKQEDLIESVTKTYNDGINLIKRKNLDYATNNDAFSNFRSAQIINISPEKAILLRSLDKISRISNLLDKNCENQVEDEKIEDTLLDVINYFAILKAFLENKKLEKK